MLGDFGTTLEWYPTQGYGHAAEVGTKHDLERHSSHCPVKPAILRQGNLPDQNGDAAD